MMSGDEMVRALMSGSWASINDPTDRVNRGKSTCDDVCELRADVS